MADSESPLKQTNSPQFSVGFNRIQLLAGDLNPRRVADTNESNSYTPLLIQNEIITLACASTVAIQRRELQNRPAAAKKLAVVADPFTHYLEINIREGLPFQPGRKDDEQFYNGNSSSC
ncbi:hypothetical protein [Microseira sp. BLCC-F43]|jgi:hypothetical protein|uniref:hypothetical protein n=1 Tax=Microseira sp. BLCC-F43 TaxID=3153602 RepID=UPI0035B9FB3F